MVNKRRMRIGLGSESVFRQTSRSLFAATSARLSFCTPSRSALASQTLDRLDCGFGATTVKDVLHQCAFVVGLPFLFDAETLSALVLVLDVGDVGWCGCCWSLPDDSPSRC